MSRNKIADLSKSLDELQGCPPGDPADAPTGLVREVMLARRTPLNQLSADQIGRLIAQRDGIPFILDLVFPKLEADPLFDGGYYPGDVLSNLIRADETTWLDRPAYRARLEPLYRRALATPVEDHDALLESLGIEVGRLAN